MKKQNKSEMILPHISYHKILDQIKDGIFITDIKQKIVYWNYGAEELTKFKASEIVGRFCYDIGALCKKDHKGHTLCSPNVCPLAKALIDNKSGIYPHIVFMETKKEEELPVSINVGPIHDIEGNIVGGICVFRDMRDEYRQRKLAGEIQKKMVTLGKIRKNGLLIETVYKPVEEIGGDFLEAFFLDDKSLVATVADATGHGISASLFTVIYKTLLHSSFTYLHYPAEVLKNVNHGFLQTSQIDGYYITAAMLIFNPVTRTGKFSSAGHPPALIFKKKDYGYILRQELNIRSLMIGVEDNVQFKEIDFHVESDEFLLICSDGLIEAECKGGKSFGVRGIEVFLSHYTGYDILNDLLAHLNEQSIYVELTDDVSMIKIEPLQSF
jgi:sigma-B regulation protein RsbU (phosphoserine phosphatase)